MFVSRMGAYLRTVEEGDVGALDDVRVRCAWCRNFHTSGARLRRGG